MLVVWHGVPSTVDKLGFWVADEHYSSDGRRHFIRSTGTWLPFVRRIDCELAARSLNTEGLDTVEKCLAAGCKTVRPIMFRDLQW